MGRVAKVVLSLDTGKRTVLYTAKALRTLSGYWWVSPPDVMRLIKAVLSLEPPDANWTTPFLLQGLSDPSSSLLTQSSASPPSPKRRRKCGKRPSAAAQRSSPNSEITSKEARAEGFNPPEDWSGY